MFHGPEQSAILEFRVDAVGGQGRQSIQAHLGHVWPVLRQPHLHRRHEVVEERFRQERDLVWEEFADEGDEFEVLGAQDRKLSEEEEQKK